MCQQAADNVSVAATRAGRPAQHYLFGSCIINPASGVFFAAFIKTPEMLDCIAEGLDNPDDAYSVIAAGDLGYCEVFDFKCASSRTCDAWIAGGPVEKQTYEEERQQKENKQRSSGFGCIGGCAGVGTLIRTRNHLPSRHARRSGQLGKPSNRNRRSQLRPA